MAIRISLGFSGFVAHNLASSANIHVNNCCGIHRCWVRSLLFGTNQLEALVTNDARESEIQAVATIDGEIGPQLSVRRKREGVGATYFDANMYPQGSMGVVPEALRPKPGHLSLSQQRVYEDFVRLPWQNQSIQSSHVLPVATTASSGILVSLAHMVQHPDNLTRATHQDLEANLKLFLVH